MRTIKYLAEQLIGIIIIGFAVAALYAYHQEHRGFTEEEAALPITPDITGASPLPYDIDDAVVLRRSKPNKQVMR